MNFAYTGKAQSVTLEPGKYVLECWGAQGGYRSNSSYGGKGGYSTGTLTLTQKLLYTYMSVDLEILLHQHQIQSIPEVSMVVDIDTIIKVVVALLIFVLEVLLYTPVLSLQVAVVLMVILDIVADMLAAYLVLGVILDVVHMDMVDLKLLHIHL